MARLAGDTMGQQENIESNELDGMSATDDVNQDEQQTNKDDRKNDIMTSRKIVVKKDRHLDIWAEDLRNYIESGSGGNLQLVSTRIPEALWDIVTQVCRYQKRPIKDFVHDAIVHELKRVLE